MQLGALSIIRAMAYASRRLITLAALATCRKALWRKNRHLHNALLPRGASGSGAVSLDMLGGRRNAAGTGGRRHGRGRNIWQRASSLTCCYSAALDDDWRAGRGISTAAVAAYITLAYLYDISRRFTTALAAYSPRSAAPATLLSAATLAACSRLLAKMTAL